MPATNAIGEERRCRADLPVLPAAELTAVAQLCEYLGCEGLYAVQVNGPPFIQHCATDEMVAAFVTTGSMEEVAETLEPLWGGWPTISAPRPHCVTCRQRRCRSTPRRSGNSWPGRRALPLSIDRPGPNSSARGGTRPDPGSWPMIVLEA